MGYQHIDNLYKNQDILLFRECYALEKIHGTSAHITWENSQLRFFVGGCKQSEFENLFNPVLLVATFIRLGQPEITVYGEAYGGKMQKMSDTYGKDLRFIAFEIKIGDCWLAVPDAQHIVRQLGFEFVHYVKIPTTLEALDIERDAPSIQAQRNGIVDEKPREGIVLRPLIEVTKNNGDRIIAKHKGDKFKETKTPRQLAPDKLIVLQEAKAIADEWVTEMRLIHVLDAFGPGVSMEETGAIIKAMVGDIEREGTGEIIMSKAAKTAIGRRTAELLKTRFTALLRR